ncbi:hypothetical protein AERO9A_250072 [Aeromonas salmonicida]|nr:hypothetical protein AERO9A_250072 [Aeromonas salmonicida]
MLTLLKAVFEHYFLLSPLAVSVYTPRRSKGNSEAGRRHQRPERSYAYRARHAETTDTAGVWFL